MERECAFWMRFVSFGGTTECTGADMYHFAIAMSNLVLGASTLVVFVYLVAVYSFWWRVVHFGRNHPFGGKIIHFYRHH